MVHNCKSVLIQKPPKILVSKNINNPFFLSNRSNIHRLWHLYDSLYSLGRPSSPVSLTTPGKAPIPIGLYAAAWLPPAIMASPRLIRPRSDELVFLYKSSDLNGMILTVEERNLLCSFTTDIKLHKKSITRQKTELKLRYRERSHLMIYFITICETSSITLR